MDAMEIPTSDMQPIDHFPSRRSLPSLVKENLVNLSNYLSFARVPNTAYSIAAWQASRKIPDLDSILLPMVESSITRMFAPSGLSVKEIRHCLEVKRAVTKSGDWFEAVVLMDLGRVMPHLPTLADLKTKLYRLIEQTIYKRLSKEEHEHFDNLAKVYAAKRKVEGSRRGANGENRNIHTAKQKERILLCIKETMDIFELSASDLIARCRERHGFRKDGKNLPREGVDEYFMCMSMLAKEVCKGKITFENEVPVYKSIDYERGFWADAHNRAKATEWVAALGKEAKCSSLEDEIKLVLGEGQYGGHANTAAFGNALYAKAAADGWYGAKPLLVKMVRNSFAALRAALNRQKKDLSTWWSLAEELVVAKYLHIHKTKTGALPFLIKALPTRSPYQISSYILRSGDRITKLIDKQLKKQSESDD